VLAKKCQCAIDRGCHGSEPGRQIGAEKSQRIVRVEHIPRAHPLQLRGELLAAPHVVGEAGAQDVVQRQLARAAQPRIDDQALDEAGLQGKDAEAMLLDEVAEQAMLENVELGDAVNCLTEPDHRGIRYGSPEVGEVVVRRGRVDAIRQGSHMRGDAAHLTPRWP